VTRTIDELEASPRWAPAELFALTGLVIAQPVLDITGRSPDMFLFRRADRLDILLLVAAVTVLPALTIWVVEVLAGLVSGRLGATCISPPSQGCSCCWRSRWSRPRPACAGRGWPRSPRPPV